MPGIVAIISRNKPSGECENLVQAMLASMMHERFYVSGSCFVPQLGIYGAWVAHPSSFAASVSGFYDKDGVALAFAGECFPDDLERAKIGSEGPNGDVRGVNWLVNRYLEQGERFVETLNGLFSGLLIDRNRQCAFIFNDRYGIERIYYHETKDAIYFASEAKALLCVLPELRAFDEKGVAQFLAFGCTLERQTLFRGVNLLPGGSNWRTEQGAEWRKSRYFVPENWSSRATLTEDEFDSAFDSTFRRILKRYVGTGAGLGISLTGGLDTRMIMACRPETRVHPICYTFSGRTEQTLDASIAARIASECGLEHRVLRINDDFLRSYGKFVDRTVIATDGCSGATGAHEIYFSQLARELAPVRLTGNFGSEVLRGMSTFKPLRLADGLLADATRKSVAEAAECVPGSTSHPVTLAAFHEIPWNLYGNLAAGRSQVTFRTPYLDNELVALAYRLPPSLRASPLPALRLVHRNRPALAEIPTDRGQLRERRDAAWLFRRLFSEVTFKLDYMHKEGLPSPLALFDPMLHALSVTGILGLHKFLPYRRWFREQLATTVSEILTDRRTREARWWNTPFLATMWANHVRGRGNYVREINAILTLEAVERLILNGSRDLDKDSKIQRSTLHAQV